MDKKTAESRQSYNQKAKTYEDTPEGRFTLSYNLLIKEQVELKNGDTILDVACGNGRLLQMLAQKARIKAYGIDVSEEMIKTARAANPGMGFLVGSAETTPFEDNQFDLVTVCCAFHHFTQPAAFMAEADRILKPGGRLIIADPCLPPVLRQLENLILPFLKMGDVKCYSPKELTDFFQKNGFIKVTGTKRGTQLIMAGEKRRLL
ncbi:class I SAM-dependent methyltransferase [Acetobacterium wieringae]|uniref:class I SAM-dependent methyltransferase n=1 Tax=Acetobacterium wieringae TaxID=52694 RepID=UPI0026ECFEA4|nr:class I SAM-dependent methyltransferase [Acetobacterium wieringae]